ncbi:hypothetical protein TNIN_108901 [Trichonephila inaurata madagascariensis]|uniref:Uncharacterized protein n=1 Tax=Trichonephila inaurata madagascariensis TaxID=2747483 RepID=A0A8X7CES0_9ARAC|nr:hypothetical protein TNIN_108901 [Trichonephila inaurata madagascariensis]
MDSKSLGPSFMHVAIRGSTFSISSLTILRIRWLRSSSFAVDMSVTLSSISYRSGTTRFFLIHFTATRNKFIYCTSFAVYQYLVEIFSHPIPEMQYLLIFRHIDTTHFL